MYLGKEGGGSCLIPALIAHGSACHMPPYPPACHMPPWHAVDVPLILGVGLKSGNSKKQLSTLHTNSLKVSFKMITKVNFMSALSLLF